MKWEIGLFSIKDISNCLPEDLNQIFLSDPKYPALSITAINKFSDWFNHSGIPFFKNYTDHSAQHSYDVFRTCIDFIPNQSYQYLTSKDICVLLISCFCHDCGMHVTEKQFSNLIGKEQDNNLPFDEASWASLWVQFLEEAKRFNQNMLYDIFGDTEPIDIPPISPIDYTDRHRLLIGEFLRRNHARLAHEIATGLDVELELPELLAEFEDAERDIIGLISRSHGMAIRETFEYIRKHYHLRDFNRIHIVYLMTVIRIADYAQIQAVRASVTKSKIHNISSPISRQEWRVHNSVKNITRTHDDPESVFVDTVPENVQDYLRVKHWLTDLQKEIDLSWAILGEIYGRQTDTGLSNLEIAIRRVRSSIFELPQKVPYLAKEVRFRVAEAEMLSLLLEPLYGDHPGYGLRELIQNATDAVREAIHNRAEHLKSDRPRVDVTCHFSDEENFCEIRDNGVGMSEDVLTNYFLNAGASFRSSSQWRKDFLDDQSHSKIVRSGRFGVGALASFIIGDSIKVQTCHYKAPQEGGLQFVASLHDRNIEVRNTECSAGTCIRIDIAKKNIRPLRMFLREIESYFSFESAIKVNVEIKGGGEKKKINLNSDNKIKSKPYYQFRTKKYSKIKIYLHRRKMGKTDREGICYINGIAVSRYSRNESNLYYSRDSSLIHLREQFKSPANLDRYYGASSRQRLTGFWSEVTDKDGIAPLNLPRTTFDAPDAEAEKKICKFAFDRFLEGIRLENSPILETMTVKNKGIDELYHFYRSAFLFGTKGFCPNDGYILNSMGRKKVIKLLDPEVVSFSDLDAEDDELYGVSTGYSLSPSSIIERLRWYRTIEYTIGASRGIIFTIPSDLAERTLKLSNVSRWIESAITDSEELQVNGSRHRLIRFGKVDEKDANRVKRVLEKTRSKIVEYHEVNRWIMYKGYSEEYEEDEAPTEFSRLWVESVGGLLKWGALKHKSGE